jgi:hypothetical protein
MPNYTAKEIAALQNQLDLEELLVKKYYDAASKCASPQIKEKLTQAAKQHKQHFDTLYNHLM